jgi:hypothetical protein
LGVIVLSVAMGYSDSGLVSIGPKGMGCLSIKGRWWAFLLLGLRR